MGPGVCVPGAVISPPERTAPRIRDAVEERTPEVFLPVLAVPAPLVVVLGYVVGHAVWAWLTGLLDPTLGTSLAAGAEPAGWITGVLLLAAVVRLLAVRRRRRR